MATGPRTLGWDHFREVAEELFRVLGRSELLWAQQAWEHVQRAGLATVDSELDRYRVAIRFMALACVFRDFSGLAWKKRLAPHFGEWAVYLDLHPLRVGQLLGPPASLPDTATEDELLDIALQVLTNRERATLHRVLQHGWGSASRLFVALWRTHEHPPGTPGAARERRETDDEILNDLSFEKIDAYEFVSKGLGAPEAPVEL